MRLHVPVALRWSDLDAYQHVNNVEMFRLFEEARIIAFWRHPESGEGAWPTAVLGNGPDSDSPSFVAHQEIEYLKPLPYSRTPLRIEMWVGRLGGASAQVCYEVHDGSPTGFDRVGPASGAEPYARAATSVVMIDAATLRPRPLTDPERLAWEPFREEPVRFRGGA